MKEKKMIKCLRFKDEKGNDYPGWKEKKLGAVFTFRPTNSFSRDDLNYEGGSVKNIHYGDIHTRFKTHFDVLNETVPFVNEEISLKKLSVDSFCKEGDLIIADASEDYADIGKCIEIVNLNNEKVICGLHTLHARPNLDMVVVGFSGHLMKSENIRLQIKTLAQGTKVLSITTSRLANIAIHLPTLKEQTKIANFLSAIDKKIENLEKELDELKAYKKGVMQAIFREGDENQWGGGKSLINNYLENFRFKDEDGNDYPDWEEKKLGEVTFKVDQKNKNIEKLPIYSISNVNGFVPQSEQFEGMDSNERGYDISLYKIIENNTFAYNPARINVGSIGYSGNLGRVIVSSLYVCFKTVESLNDLFFNQYLDTMHFKNSVISKGEGGVRIYLFYENFSDITISLPCLSEQFKIAKFLSAIDEKISLCNTQIANTEQYKKGLLQQMFV